ncbi:MAG: PTS system mannose/fructose/sorbose family transporter subunit IID [bacterium]
MLSKMDRFKIFFRALFVQAVFNFERMQNIGFVYILFPIIKRLYHDTQAQKQVILRHLASINTHPYFITSIAGLIISKEEELLKGKEGLTPNDISVLTSCVTAPLAGLGDSLFWATYRPLISFLGVIIILFGLLFGKSPILGIGFFLIIYNIVHLLVRYKGIKKGYLLKEKLLEKISKVPFQRIKTILNIIGMIFLGALSSILCWFNSEVIKIDGAKGLLIGIASLLIIIGTGIGIRVRINTFIIFLVIIGIGILLAYLKFAGIWDYGIGYQYLIGVVQ